MFVIIFIMLTFLFAEEKVFVACEGNFYQSNGSIWMIEDGEVYSYQDNPLGEIVQSLYVNDSGTTTTLAPDSAWTPTTNGTFAKVFLRVSFSSLLAF